MTCLNCGAAQTGRFCAACGQRMVPPYPTMREMVGDTWDEMVGYDGRFLRTFRVLLIHPGRLTNEVLQGRRARYIFPIRLYLFASVAYFMVAAVAPLPLRSERGIRVTSENVNLTLDDPSITLTSGQQAQLRQFVEDLPAFVQPMARSIVDDIDGFSRRLLENMPRILFVLVPFFAAVMKLFYRGGWVQQMTFSLHLHAALFLMLIARELAKFSHNLIVLGIVEVGTLVAGFGYALAATRTVYSERWVRVILKLVPIMVVYQIGYLIAVMVAIVWSANR